MNISLTEHEQMDLIISLNMRINYIETGVVTLSADDAIERGQVHLIRKLEPDQKIMLERMRRLVEILTRGSL